MKKVLLTSFLSLVLISTYGQKFKPGLGIEGGMGGGGMNSLLKVNNPMIVDNNELKKSWAYTFGGSLQLMKPGYGIVVKLNFNSFSAEAESFSTPENIKLKYTSVPILLKIRLSSKSGYTAASWSDESYTLIGNTLYHTPGQYSAGGSPFTTSVFLYGGIQYDMFKKGTHTYGTTNPVTEDLTGKLLKTGYSFVVGLEMQTNMLSLDFTYQKGLKSADPNIDNKISGFFVKLGIMIL